MNSKITKVLLIATLVLNTFTIPIYFPEESANNYKRDGLSLDIGLSNDEVASTKTLPSKSVPDLPTVSNIVDGNNEQGTKTLPCHIGIDVPKIPNSGSKTLPPVPASKTIPPEVGSKTIPPAVGSKTIPPAAESKTIPPVAEPKTLPHNPVTKTIPVEAPTNVKTISINVIPPSPTLIPPEQAEGGSNINSGSSDSISGTNVPVDDNNSEEEDNGADGVAGQSNDDIINSSDIEYDNIDGEAVAGQSNDDIINSSDIEYDNIDGEAIAAQSNDDEILNSSDIEYDNIDGEAVAGQSNDDEILNSSDIENDYENDTSNVQISTDNDQDVVDVADVSPSTKTIPPAAEGPVLVPSPENPVPESPLPSPENPVPESPLPESPLPSTENPAPENSSVEGEDEGSSVAAGNNLDVATGENDDVQSAEEDIIDSADIANSSDLEYDQIELKDSDDVAENEAPLENEVPSNTPITALPPKSLDNTTTLPPKSLDNTTALPPKSLDNNTPDSSSSPIEINLPEIPAIPGVSSNENQTTKDLPSTKLPPKELPSTENVPSGPSIEDGIDINIEVPFLDSLGLELPGIGGEDKKPADNDNVLSSDTGFTVPKPNTENEKEEGTPIEAPDLKNPKDLSQSEYEDYLKDVNNNIKNPLNYETAEDSSF